MFKHILLPTDGSELSRNAVVKALQVARSLDAKVTAVHIVPEFRVFTYNAEMVEDTKEQYLKDSKAHAAKYLAEVAQAAAEAGVTCTTLAIDSDHPYEAIIKAAQDKGCDLIAMASHGRKGVQGLLIGSETQRVLTHSTIPVLVYR